MSSPSAFRDFETLRHLEKLGALLCRAATGGMPGDRTIEVAPQLEQQELVDHIDLGDLRAVTPEDLDQVVSLQPLQRFADGSAADA